MDKKYALLLSLLITGLIASDVYLFSVIQKEQPELVMVSKIIDGDTLILQDGRKIRLSNINAPEKNTQIYELSLTYLKQFENKSVRLETGGLDKYGRTLGRIYSPSYINLELVSQGLASKFLVDKSELKEFAEAEKNAVQLSKGIWKHSEYFGCFSVEIDKYEEFVIISNNCKAINIKGWTLKDESTKIFTFQDISIGKVFLYSGEGQDNQLQLYWKQSNVWNNDRDSLYFFDKNSKIAYYQTYGY